MLEDKIDRWREICRSLKGAKPSEMAERIAQVEEVVPVAIDRDKLRLFILSVIADNLDERCRAWDGLTKSVAQGEGHD
jgi:hypothetical protein